MLFTCEKSLQIILCKSCFVSVNAECWLLRILWLSTEWKLQAKQNDQSVNLYLLQDNKEGASPIILASRASHREAAQALLEVNQHVHTSDSLERHFRAVAAAFKRNTLFELTIPNVAGCGSFQGRKTTCSQQFAVSILTMRNFDWLTVGCRMILR